MKNRTALRPAVDSLETRLALSQMSVMPMVHTADVASATTLSNRSIAGQASGSVRHVLSNPDAGQSFNLSGSGRFKGLGTVRVSGTVHGTGFIMGGTSTGKVTLSNSKGSITLALTGPAQSGFSALPDSYQYVITGGTGAYRSLSGHGNVIATWKPTASAPQHFQFTFASA